MEEKVIKKTVELICSDIKKIAQPVGKGVMKGSRMLFYSIIMGASFILLYFSRGRVKRLIIERVMGWKDSSYEEGDWVTAWGVGVSIAIGAYFFYRAIIKPIFTDSPIPESLLLFLGFTNLIGLGHAIFTYFYRKKEQAVELLEKKRELKKTKQLPIGIGVNK